MKSKILSSILVASSLLMGQAFAEHHGGGMDMEKVKFMGATGMLSVPKFKVVDGAGVTQIMMMADLKLTKAEMPYELQIVELKSVKEAKAGDHDDHDKPVFSIATSTLTLPEVHIMGADGMMTGMMSAELKVISFIEPFTLQVTSLVAKEMPSMDMDKPKKGDVDSKGCVYPETWHEPMNHCMDQTSLEDEKEDKMPMPGDKDSYGCVYPETWHAAMKHCMAQAK